MLASPQSLTGASPEDAILEASPEYAIDITGASPEDSFGMVTSPVGAFFSCRTVVVSNVVATTTELRVRFRFHGDIQAAEHLNGDK